MDSLLQSVGMASVGFIPALLGSFRALPCHWPNPGITRQSEGSKVQALNEKIGGNWSFDSIDWAEIINIPGPIDLSVCGYQVTQKGMPCTSKIRPSKSMGLFNGLILLVIFWGFASPPGRHLIPHAHINDMTLSCGFGWGDLPDCIEPCFKLTDSIE